MISKETPTFGNYHVAFTPISKTFRAAAWILVLVLLTFPVFSRGDCPIPPEWDGEWFIKDMKSHPPTVINSTGSFIQRYSEHDSLGECILHKDGFFVFSDPINKCSKCAMITEKDRNVLYSKEAIYCKFDESWDKEHFVETLCNELFYLEDRSRDHFWFRVGGEAIDCPFKDGPYEFSYWRTNARKCENPISHGTACPDSTKMQLRYEACHDSNNNGKTEQLRCIGYWKEGSYNHLVAEVSSRTSNGGRFSPVYDLYRCYSIQEKKEEKTIPGRTQATVEYKVGISEDPSCMGLTTPDEGATVIIMQKAKPSLMNTDIKSCTFPPWLTQHHWENFERSMVFKVHSQGKQQTIHISPLKRKSDEKGSIGFHDLSRVTDQITFPPTQASHLQCISKRNVSTENETDDNHIAFLAKYSVGCNTEDICVHFVRRSDYIFQMYFMEKHDQDIKTFRDHCFAYSIDSLKKGGTMLSTEGKMESSCPHRGKYAVINEEWDIGCETPNKVVIGPSPNSISINNYYNCTSGWEDDTRSYTVLASSSNSMDDFNPTLLCMVQENGDDTQVFITSQDCMDFNTETVPTSKEVIHPDYDSRFGLYDDDRSSSNTQNGIVKVKKSAPCHEHELENDSEVEVNIGEQKRHPETFSSSSNLFTVQVTGISLILLVLR